MAPATGRRLLCLSSFTPVTSLTTTPSVPPDIVSPPLLSRQLPLNLPTTGSIPDQIWRMARNMRYAWPQSSLPVLDLSARVPRSLTDLRYQGASAQEQLVEACRRNNVELLTEIINNCKNDDELSDIMNNTKTVMGNHLYHEAALQGNCTRPTGIICLSLTQPCPWSFLSPD